MKKLNNNKGITLIALIITIIFLIILASIGTYSGVQVVKSAQFTAFTTELKIMQTQVNSLYDKKINGEKVLINNEELDVDDVGSEISSNDKVQEQANIVYLAIQDEVDSLDEYRYYNKETIKGLGIEGVEGEFFVDVSKRSVVSYEGMKYEGTTYYTLNQLDNNSLYNVDYKENGGNPTFDVDYQYNKNSGIYTINIKNIVYQGNISKWDVQYKLETQTTWNTSQNLIFDVKENGIYEIKLKNGNVITSEAKIIDVEPNYYLVMMEATKAQYAGKTNIGTIGEFRDLVNSKNFNYDIAYVIEDINMECDENHSWTPIGRNSGTYFNAIFDGKGHNISGLVIKNSQGGKGLFGYNEGEIKNLTITGEVNCAGAKEVGGVAGTNNGKIDNCISNVVITGQKYIGGITGINRGIISNCTNLNNVYGSNIEESDWETYFAAGIAGYNTEDGQISKCKNAGNVNAENFTCIGGIVGDNQGIIKLCVNSGEVTYALQSGGGIVGYFSTNVVIENCYNIGTIKGQTNVGGIVGTAQGGGITKNCYNIANVEANSAFGGIVGHNYIYCLIENCYYLNTLSMALYGINSGDIDKVSSSKSEAELKSAEFISTLNADGTMFKEDYAGNSSINNGYPILNWQ